MTRLLLSLVIACGPGLVLAATPAAQTALPVDQAAYHVPVFRGDILTVLRVNIPGKRTSDYHTHGHDQVCVVVEDYPPEAYSQPLGGPPGAPRGAAHGETTFIPYASNPITHRAVNPGVLARHSICAELNRPQPLGLKPAARSSPGYAQLLDNDRVRAWRLVLAPGQSAPVITQSAPGLRVIVSGGEIAETSPGRQDRGMVLRQGEFYLQDAGATRGVSNIGTTRVELVEFEIK